MQRKALKSSESGFSMVETLVALGVMGILCSTLALALVAQARMNKHSQIVAGAVVAAERVLDNMRAAPITDLPTTGSQTTSGVIVGPNNFTVVSQFCRTSSICSGGSTVRQVTLDVKLNSKSIYGIETVFSQFD